MTQVATARGSLVSPWEATGETPGGVWAWPSAHLLHEACGLCLLLTCPGDRTSSSWKVSRGQLCTQASLSPACAPHHLPRATASESSPKRAPSRDAENLKATGQVGTAGPATAVTPVGGSGRLVQRTKSQALGRGTLCGLGVISWLHTPDQQPCPHPRVLPCWGLASGGTLVCFWKVILGGFCLRFLTLPPWRGRGLWTDKVDTTSACTELKIGGAGGEKAWNRSDKPTTHPFN